MASFADLKMLYTAKEKKILKVAPNLNYKALYPTNIEQQKVSQALKKWLLHCSISQK